MTKNDTERLRKLVSDLNNYKSRLNRIERDLFYLENVFPISNSGEINDDGKKEWQTPPSRKSIHEIGSGDEINTNNLSIDELNLCDDCKEKSVNNTNDVNNIQSPKLSMLNSMSESINLSEKKYDEAKDGFESTEMNFYSDKNGYGDSSPVNIGRKYDITDSTEILSVSNGTSLSLHPEVRNEYDSRISDMNESQDIIINTNKTQHKSENNILQYSEKDNDEKTELFPIDKIYSYIEYIRNIYIQDRMRIEHQHIEKILKVEELSRKVLEIESIQQDIIKAQRYILGANIMESELSSRKNRYDTKKKQEDNVTGKTSHACEMQNDVGTIKGNNNETKKIGGDVEYKKKKISMLMHADEKLEA